MPSFATIALLTHTGKGGATPLASAAIDTTGATLIVVTASAAGIGPQTLSVSDNKGNTWTALTAQEQTSSNSARVQLYYTIPTSVGSGHTFTVTATGTGFGGTGVEVEAFSGTAASSVFDVENQGQVNASATIQPGSVAPNNANSVVISADTTDANFVVSSVNSSFTITDNNGATKANTAMAYIIQTSASAVNPTWTNSGSAGAVATIAVFKAAVGVTTHQNILQGVSIIQGVSILD